MTEEELIEALVKFTERTGAEWESLYDHNACSGEFTVRFINLRNGFEEDTELELDKQFLKVCKQMRDEQAED